MTGPYDREAAMAGLTRAYRGAFRGRMEARFDESRPSGDNRKVASLQPVGLWRSLGARFHGMEEVVGSIPTRSTKSNQSFRQGERSKAMRLSRGLCHNPPFWRLRQGFP